MVVVAAIIVVVNVMAVVVAAALYELVGQKLFGSSWCHEVGHLVDMACKDI